MKADTTGRLHRHHLTGATIFGASSHGELKTLAIVVDAVNDTHQEPRDHTHHVWAVVDAAVDFQIVRRLARQPLHKATDSSLGTQALHLWTALRHLSKQVVLHLVKQESHRYCLGNRHIDLHADNQLAEHMPTGGDTPLQDHMHTHLKHLPPVPRPGEQPAWVPDDRIYNDIDDIDIPPEYTICPCHLQQPETWKHFKQCPLAQGGNHLATWTPEVTIAQHARLGQATPLPNEVRRLMRQPEIKEAVLRGAVPLQLYRVIADHAPETRATVRHMQLTTIKRADTQLQHRVQVYAQEAQQTSHNRRTYYNLLIHYQHAQPSD